jgi:hypothetical protein
MAVQRDERLLPLLIGSGFAWAEGDSERAEVRGAAGLVGACEHVRSRLDYEIEEASGRNDQGELSFQETTGNSTGPEREVLLGALRDCLLDKDYHAFSRLESTQAERVARACEGRDRRLRDRATVVGVAKQLRQGTSNDKVETMVRIVSNQRVLILDGLAKMLQVDCWWFDGLYHARSPLR